MASPENLAYEANLRARHIYKGTQLAAAEMIRGGTTTALTCISITMKARALLRKAECARRPQRFCWDFARRRRKIASGIAWAREWRGAADGRITPMLAPHSLYTCTRAQWEKIVAGAHEHNIQITTHVSETRRENIDVATSWGCLAGSIAPSNRRLRATAFGRTLRSHRPARPRNMANAPFFVAHNPQSNLKLGSGIAPVDDYRARGICVGLAPDGTASNNNLDMWEELRLAATLHKARRATPR